MNDLERIDKIQNTDSIILETIDNFLSRGEIGLLKYGKTLDRDDKSLTEWIDKAIQEQMDSILYLTKIKKTIIKNSKIFKREPPTFIPKKLSLLIIERKWIKQNVNFYYMQ